MNMGIDDRGVHVGIHSRHYANSKEREPCLLAYWPKKEYETVAATTP
jgi:hypothetical protein